MKAFTNNNFKQKESVRKERSKGMNVFHIPFKKKAWSKQEAYEILPLLKKITMEHKDEFEKNLNTLHSLSSKNKALLENLESLCDNTIRTWERQIKALGVRTLGLWQILFRIKEENSKKVIYGVWTDKSKKIKFIEKSNLKPLIVRKIKPF